MGDGDHYSHQSLQYYVEFISHATEVKDIRVWRQVLIVQRVDDLREVCFLNVALPEELDALDQGH